MSFKISMFSGSTDLDDALTLLAQTAMGLPRDSNRLTLEQAHEHYCSGEGYNQLLRTAERFKIDPETLPERQQLDRLFRDELLSRKALQTHAARNVYNSGKVALWQALWEPFKDKLLPNQTLLQTMAHMTALNTSAAGGDVQTCVDWLLQQLKAMDFSVETLTNKGQAPILFARRAAMGMQGHLVLYGHYDTVKPQPERWDTDPLKLTLKNNRLYGCGIGDNKGALAVRLQTIAGMDKAPALTWIIQGEEEIASPFAHQQFPSLLSGVKATLWLEETGYHDNEGTQRLLARVIGNEQEGDLPPDRALWPLIDSLAQDAALWKVGYRVESRSLNKAFFQNGCPFNKQLPTGARYLAIGINDPRSGIHKPNESIPAWTIRLHQRQLATVFEWINRIAAGE
ncbi:MAG TPA: M20/M25/M40 family metallo-hydrolase [Thioploca sp.]|nr:MAG: hypothetical protein B6247_07080 [Beggiatoa sp. 4572_84]RKZ61927.1 MAG: hypothetical protein DRR08_07470 [Gammaproteobacteria bacterium]HDN27136.1 M20/M25/M40 family metallo-hydrolase [Thioploca sp.]